MVTTVTLTDTGKRVIGGSAVETQANSGTALTLHVDNVTYSLEALLGGSPIVGKTESNTATNMYDYTEIDHVGVGIPTWVIKLRFFDGSGAEQVSSGTANTITHFGVLNSMVRTKGYKEMVSDLGKHSDEGGTTTTINCRIKSLQVTHDAGNNIISATLTLLETV